MEWLRRMRERAPDPWNRPAIGLRPASRRTPLPPSGVMQPVSTRRLLQSVGDDQQVPIREFLRVGENFLESDPMKAPLTFG